MDLPAISEVVAFSPGQQKANWDAMVPVFAQNQALLGGLRIKVGSDVYDGSIQSRLAALQEGF